ncbi:hypothetical protein KP509_1Z297300 [Ceratopteris richardii]|nr:hypothetical protein KP509_1Z297300 [Ceratopteris richardii]
MMIHLMYYRLLVALNYCEASFHVLGYLFDCVPEITCKDCVQEEYARKNITGKSIKLLLFNTNNALKIIQMARGEANKNASSTTERLISNFWRINNL